MMRLKLNIWVVIAAVLLAGTAGFLAGRYVSDNRKPNFPGKYVLYVRPEMSVDQLRDSVVNGAGALRPRSIDRVFRKMDVGENIKPGRYVIDASSTSIYVARMLVYGWQTPQNLTLSGTIRSKGSIAKKISAQMMVDSATIDKALNDTAFLAGYGFTPENVFAMFLPDTYQMYWTASVEDVFDRFKKEYDRFWTADRLARAEALKLTPMQVSVMASIVNGETLQKAEYPVIAGVYLNRYRKGMKLQADPTVAFCFDYTLDRILKKHLTVDSPYNTYKYKGLPPAPINVPPKACIDAVLNPDRHNYLYFCASPSFDGTHRFASS
ncbi:MAG: endolytic transglycosylase MltG, partial [Bacteroidales bacterium]|nr:endolytic transglycosylase MltG [Bacteroidales bacterium]